MARFDKAAWKREGRRLAKIERGLGWQIGDWILRAIAAGIPSPEVYDLVVAVTGFSRGGAMNYCSIARRVPSVNRRRDLPFSLHAEVAWLSHLEQKDWLAKASENGWSRNQLRVALRGEGVRKRRVPTGEAAKNVCRAARPGRNGVYVVPDRVIRELAAAVEIRLTPRVVPIRHRVRKAS